MTGERIVVGLGSPSHFRALAWAVAESTVTKARVLVVRAGVGRAGMSGGPRTLSALELVDKAAARAVAAARDRLGESKVELVLDPDSAGEALARRATSLDVIAVGVPVRSGWWARAGTAYHVVTRAPCPVVVVHEPGEPARTGIGAAFRRHVVVGVDGSSAARTALGYGFSFAAAHRAPLVAVNVTPHVDEDVWFDDAWLETHLGTDPEPAAALADELEPWHLKYPAVPVKRALVAGRPADALRRVAHDALALMVGTASTPLHPLGGVTRSLIEDATCPVVVVRERHDI